MYCECMNFFEKFHFYQMITDHLAFNHPIIHRGYLLKNSPFFKNPWRLYPENTSFFWKSWTMPSTEKHPLSPWNCRRAWLPLLKLIAVTGFNYTMCPFYFLFQHGNLYEMTSSCGWVCCILFFPLGLICCCLMKERVCSVCGYTTRNWCRLNNSSNI